MDEGALARLRRSARLGGILGIAIPLAFGIATIVLAWAASANQWAFTRLVIWSSVVSFGTSALAAIGGVLVAFWITVAVYSRLRPRDSGTVPDDGSQ